jgi:hypothetical protein
LLALAQREAAVKIQRRKSNAPPRFAGAVLLEVADAAVVWWVMKRPIQWSLEQHLARPHVNCATAEEELLAEKAAAWCAMQRDSK